MRGFLTALHKQYESVLDGQNVVRLIVLLLGPHPFDLDDDSFLTEEDA